MAPTALILTVIGWLQDAPAAEAIRGDQVVVFPEGVEQATAETIGQMIDALVRALFEQFGLETPALQVHFDIGNPHNHVLVSADGQMLIRCESLKRFEPVMPTNIALARTLLRAVVRWHLLHALKSPFGLPEGVIDGFAQYIADDAIAQATKVFTLPAEKLAPAVARYKRLLGDVDAAAGRPALSFALVSIASTEVTGFRYLAALRDALVAAVGEDAINTALPKELTESPLGFALGEPGAPLVKNPALMVSKRRVLNGIPLLDVVGQNVAEPDRITMFDAIWQYVKERYPDPSLKAVDWNGAYDSLRSLVPHCEDDTDFFLLVRQLLATLRDPNTRLMYPAGTMFYHLPHGLQIDLIGADLVVSEVTAATAAEHAGVKRGMLVDAVDGVDAKLRLEQFAELQRLWEGLPSDRLRRNRAANQLLAGPPATQVRVKLHGEDGAPLEVTLPREELQPAGGAKTAVESEVKAGNIGYVKINRFAEGMSGQFAAAIDAMPQLKALIVDVRGSQSGPQGARLAAECLSKLTRAPAIAGNWEMRNKENVNRMPQRLVPAPNAYAGPVILLIDDWSFGTAEVFAVILKTMGRARLVGTQTVGGHYDPREVGVAMGPAQAIMGTVAFVPPIPLLIEGFGVPADVVVQRTLADVRAGRDPILDRALELAR